MIVYLQLDQTSAVVIAVLARSSGGVVRGVARNAGRTISLSVGME